MARTAQKHRLGHSVGGFVALFRAVVQTIRTIESSPVAIGVGGGEQATEGAD